MKKKFIFLLVLSTLFCSLFAHDFGSGFSIPYYSKELTIQDYFAEGRIDLSENIDFSVRADLLTLNNINISNFFTADNVSVFVGNAGANYYFSNPYIESIGVNFIYAASKADNCKVNVAAGTFIDVYPDINNAFGGGITSDFGWNISLTGEYIYLKPDLTLVEDGNRIPANGYLGLIDLAKEINFNSSSLKLHAGTFYGSGEFDSDFFTRIGGFEQQYIVNGAINALSIHGLIDYSMHIKSASFTFLSGALYIPMMNNDYHYTRRLLLKALDGTEHWYRKNVDKDDNMLQNYLIIPLLFNSKVNISTSNLVVTPEFEKALVIPINLNNLKDKQETSGTIDKELIKQLLFSGLTFKLSITL